MNTPQSILRRCAAILQDYAFGLQDRMEFLCAEKVQQPLRRLRLAELEDRILLSASPMAAIAPDEFLDAVWHTAPAQFDLTGVDSPFGRQSASEVTDENAVRHELVVVDPAVDDYQQLIDDLLLGDNRDREFEILLLDESRDGIQQISEWLEGVGELDAIHIVSHGSAGNVHLGNGVLNLGNLGAYAAQIGGWHDSLSGDADILIYGCDLAADKAGRDLVEALSILTEADITASDDLTGHQSLGGDWDLELATGVVETQIAFSSTLQQQWFSVFSTNLVLNLQTDGIPGIEDATATMDSSLVATAIHDFDGNGNDGKQIKKDSSGFSQSDDEKYQLWYVDALVNPYDNGFTLDGNVDLTVFARSMNGGNDGYIEAYLAITDENGNNAVQIGSAAGAVVSGTTWASHNISFGSITDTFVAGDKRLAVKIVNRDTVSNAEIEVAYGVVGYTSTLDFNIQEVIVVTNTADAGAGSLRAAILQANTNPGLDRIVFDIPDNDPGHVYYADDLNAGALSTGSVTTTTLSDAALLSGGFFDPDYPVAPFSWFRINLDPGAPDEPTISERVIIDGYSQSGASANTRVDGSDAILRIEVTSIGSDNDRGITIDANGDGTEIRGLVVNGFDYSGIATEQNADSVVIQGNFVGTDVTGTIGIGNGDNGVQLWSDNNLVGGANPADRNVIADNSSRGVTVYTTATASGNVIENNYIGVDASGQAPLGNGTAGIQLYNVDGIQIRNNVIADNGSHGIWFRWDADNAVVENNRIGVAADGTTPMGNSSDGIVFEGGSSNNVIGTIGAGNVIAHSGSDGIHVMSGSQNTFSENSIYGNGAGIILDVGENGDQVAPVLYDAIRTGAFVAIHGDYTDASDSGTTVTFEFFATPSGGAGEGRRFLGSRNIVLDGMGSANLNEVLNASIEDGDTITATVTDQNGNTSEFSPTETVVVRDTALWFETNGATDATGSYPTSWASNNIIAFNDPNLSFGEATTDGTFSLPISFQPTEPLRALHYVDSEVDIAGGTFTLYEGDLLLVFNVISPITVGGAVDILRDDVVLFRPGSGLDYSTGTYTKLLDNPIQDPGPQNIHAISLVESNTTVGNKNLPAGTFIIARSNGATGDHANIYTYNPTSVGPGTTSNEDEVLLLDGSKMGFGTSQVQGIEMLESDITLGGVNLSQGMLLVSLNGSQLLNDTDATPGNEPLEFTAEATDIFYLDISKSEQDPAPDTVAVAYALFDGSNVGLDDGTSDEYINGITIINSVATNSPPVVNTGGGYTINEGDSVTLDASLTNDTDGDTLTFKWDLDNDGNFGEPGEPITATAIVSWVTLQSFGINDDTGGPYTIGLEVSDGVNPAVTTTTTITVNNTAPTILISDSVFGGTDEGTLYTLDLSVNEPGNDTLETWYVDWGDGTVDEFNAPFSTFTHTYQIGGTYNILVSARDEDGTWTQRDVLVPTWAMGGDAVTRFDFASGALIDSFDPTGGVLLAPIASVVGFGGDIYVAGFESDNIVRFAADGTYLGEFVAAGSAGLNGPAGMTFGPDGHLYVSNYGAGNILRFDETGSNGEVFVQAGGGLVGPAGLAFGPGGDLYVASWSNGKIYRYDGTFGDNGTTYLNSGLFAPEQIVFDGDGNLWIANSGNDEVLKYDGVTSVTYAIGGEVMGLLMSPDGIVLATDYTNGQIVSFDSTIPSPPVTTLVSLVSLPYHLAFDYDHQVVVANRADQPNLTATTTDEGIQSSTGLVITPDDIDGPTVTHYRITGITNGRLFHNDGSTEIFNGDFITLQEGRDGLRFTPDAEYYGSGATFNVQASTTGDLSDLSTAAVADITVNPIADDPVVPGGLTSPEETELAAIVIDRAAVDGAEVTHFQITSIANGVLRKNDNSMISNGNFVTWAEAQAGFKFTPGLNFNGTASFDVQASLSAMASGLGGNAVTVSIDVMAVNDAPVLDNSGTMMLTDVVQDDFNPNGDTVADIILSATGDRITDVDPLPVEGIAVIGVDDADGTWQYSTNGGGSWSSFVLNGVADGAVDNANAVLLFDTSLIRFVPGAGYSGSAGTLTFRAWDRTIGLDGDINVNVAANGGTTPFSTNTETATLQVTRVAVVANTVPGAQNLNEDSALDFSLANANSITVSDGLASDNPLTTSLAVSNGKLNLGSMPGGLTVIAGADGSSSMVIQGLESEINTALDGLRFTPNANYFGSANLNVETSLLADIVGFYSFDNPGDPGNNDSPGGGNDGNVFGANATTDGGRSVLTFDGNDSVRITGTFGDPTSVTLTAWVNLDAGYTNDEVISLGDNVVIRTDATGVGVQGFFFDGVTWRHTNSGSFIAGTGWHHVAYTVNDAASEQILYIDGAEVARTTHAGPVSYSLGSNTRLGRNGSGPTHYLHGMLDDARIYSRVITLEEVASLFSERDSAQSTVSVSVTPRADAPNITATTTDEDSQSGSGLVITASGVDAATVTHYRITGITSGSLFQTDGAIGISNGDFITAAEGLSGLKFTPTSDYFGTTATFTVQASTTGDLTDLSTGVVADITVKPVADDPIVPGGLMTPEETEFIGIVIDRALQDSTEVTHFLVTSVTDGTLRRDDNSLISNGDFITYAESQAGVKFTPGSAFNGTASFDVQASITNTVAGLGGNAVTVFINVTPVNDPPGGSLTINGTLAEDQALTLTDAITDEDGMGPVAYQWQRNGGDIFGANTSGYTLTDLDVGQSIRVVATYTDGLSKPETVYSPVVGPIANVNDPSGGSLTITGTATEDQTLTLTDSITDNDGMGPVAYQWQRNGVGISGATGTSYVLGDSDVGTIIRVVATYTDGHGTLETVISSVVGPISNVNDNPGGSLSIIGGTPVEDQTLTLTDAITDDDAMGPVSYQWQRNGNDIAGAIGTGYTLSDPDVGQIIRVVATYVDGHGTAETVFSSTVGPIGNVNDSPGGSLTISGIAAEDQMLMLVDLITDADGMGPVSYQWQRDGMDIVGANGTTWVLDDIDVGSTIRVVARYTDLQGNVETVISGSVGPVANVNDQPVINDASLSIDENANYGTVVGALSFSDIDPGTDGVVTLAITSGNSGNAFVIDNSGNITVSGSIDFETTTIYSLQVTATDGGIPGLSDIATVSITVNDLNDVAPIIVPVAAQSIVENTPVGQSVVTMTATDPDTPVTSFNWTILTGNTGSVFSMDALTGTISVADDTGLDAETNSLWTLIIVVSDGRNSSAAVSVTISAVDANEFAVGPLSDVNGASNEYVIGTLPSATGVTALAADADVTDSVTYSLDDDAGGRFAINAINGVVSWIGSPLDSPELQTIVVRATSTDGSFATQSYSIDVSALFAPPPVAAGVDVDVDADEPTKQAEADSEVDPIKVAPTLTNGESAESESPRENSLTTVPTDEASTPPTATDVVTTILPEQEQMDARGWRKGDLGSHTRLRLAGTDDDTHAIETSHSRQLKFLSQPTALWDTLDENQSHLNDAIASQTLVIGTTGAVTSGFTVGYVLWILRGGALISSVLAQMPAWSLMDPLTVLQYEMEEDENAESLEEIFDDHLLNNQNDIDPVV